MHTQWVYYSKTAQADIGRNMGRPPTLKEMRMLLGGKGAGLAEISSLGLSVPLGFTLTTEACMAYLGYGAFPDGLWMQVLDGINYIEQQTGKHFGDPVNPLLVSVRTGARVSMPGMMDAILNIGLNDKTCMALANLTGDQWFAYDTYRRFIAMFSDLVMGYRREYFEQKLDVLKEYEGVKEDTEVNLKGLIRLVEEYKAMYQTQFSKDFPIDPYQQLELAIQAGFNSWNSVRAVAYREHEGIPPSWGIGVNVHMMVFSNLGNDSSTGIVFSRDPATGDRHLYGEYLPNVPGEAMFWGTSNAVDIRQLSQTMPDIYSELITCVRRLENHFRDMQDLEFTVERGRLWLLQSRNGKRSARAAVKIAVDMADEGLISQEEAVMRVHPEAVGLALHPIFDPFAVAQAQKQGKQLTQGLAASPGVAVGRMVLDAEVAEAWAKEGNNCILVREATSAYDVAGVLKSKGVLSRKDSLRGNLVVICLSLNIPAIVGIDDIAVDLATRTAHIGAQLIHEGDIIAIDGGTGEIFLGNIPMISTASITELWTLLAWADQFVFAPSVQGKPERGLAVWANADYQRDIQQAREFGSRGVGLCRTEHMFFEVSILEATQRMIVTQTQAERDRALNDLMLFQEQEFEDIFEAAQGMPVIIRLLDPPLYEYLPSHQDLIEQAATLRVTQPDSDELERVEALLATVSKMVEQNPMSGLRGCRVGIMYSGITEMQTRAILQAACRCAKRGIPVQPRLLIPMVSHVNELKLEKEKLEAVAQQVLEEEGITVSYRFGVMIETPRAALTADEIAKHAQFFSFGTNDLTQATFSLSRDDAERQFMLQYVEQEILSNNPFQVLDQKGVGRLMELCIKDARTTNPDLEIGICGNHAGEPDSIEFCYRLGLDYVSCSPFRVPVARLAAAQAVLRYRRELAMSANDLESAE